MKNLGQRSNDLDIVVKKDLPTLSNTGGTELLTVNGTSVSIVTRDTAQTISSTKTFSSSPVLNNTKILKGKNTGGTSYDLIGISSNNTVDVGNTSQTMVLNCGGGSGGTGYVRPNNDNSKSLGTAGYRWKDIYISGEFADGNNANYGVKLPNTTNFTESKTLATTDQIPTVNNPTITFTQGGTTKGTITLNQSSNQTIALDAGGGGGSVSIDNTSITENSSNQIQTVGVIDQKTGNANKQWTGTLQEYNLLGTHDSNTYYTTTDGGIYKGDVLIVGRKLSSGTVSPGTTVSGVNDTVVEYWVASDKKKWYRKWASGWKECGGYAPDADIRNDYTVVFPTGFTFTDSNYKVQLTTIWAASYGAFNYWCVGSQSLQTSTQFICTGQKLHSNAPNNAPFYWEAKGY